MALGISKTSMNLIEDLLDDMAKELGDEDGETCMRFTITPAFLLLAKEADMSMRNRRVKTELLANELDEDGVHVMHMQFLHNDVEWRTRWLLKMRDQSEPEHCWLDCDFDLFTKLTREVRMRSIETGKCT